MQRYGRRVYKGPVKVYGRNDTGKVKTRKHNWRAAGEREAGTSSLRMWGSEFTLSVRGSWWGIPLNKTEPLSTFNSTTWLWYMWQRSYHGGARGEAKG